MSHRNYKLPVPYSRGNYQQGTVRVRPATKPPKLRFRPGQVVKHDGTDHVVQYAYRVKENPHEWYFCVEEIRSSSPSELASMINSYAKLLGLGQSTPRIVYELFVDHHEAGKYFWDIPCEGLSRSIVSNKTLLKENPSV